MTLFSTCVILAVCDVVKEELRCSFNSPLLAGRTVTSGLECMATRHGTVVVHGEAVPPAKVTPLRPSIGNPDDTQQLGKQRLQRQETPDARHRKPQMAPNL